MKKAIIFGGNSYEHEISIVSAITLKGALKQEFEFIFLSLDRVFYHIEPKNMKATYFSSGDYKKAKSLTLKNGGFFTDGMFSKKIEFDVIINLIHGMDGEDGKISALFEFYEIPYIGANISSAVMSYDKVLTKLLANLAGVETLEYEVIKSGEKPKMKPPFILKPARLGSSIGINVVSELSELEYGLDSSFEYDDTVLVEPFIKGVREFNLAGCRVDGEFKLSFIEEPKKGEILDFDQKYLSFSGNSGVQIAKNLAEISTKIEESFKRVYDFGGFDGAIIRCDFFEIDGKVYLNEINPHPGSLAYYLFDDFESVLNSLAKSLKPYKKISLNYGYITKISSNK